MSSGQKIQIYSHWDEVNHRWQSNYEQEKFWPANLRTGWHTDQFVKSLSTIFEQNKDTYSLSVDHYEHSQQGYYLVFYGNVDSMIEHHGLAFLTKEIVEKCNQGILKLLIVFVHETFDTNISTRLWFDNFCQKLSQIGLSKSNSVTILTSTKFLAEPNIDHRCEIVYYPWFEADLQATFKYINKPVPKIEFDKKTKHYINLNLVVRPHRFLMVMYLFYRQVNHYGNISWKNPQLLDWQNLLSNHGHDQHDFSWMRQLDNFTFGLSNTSFSSFVSAHGVLESMDLDQISLHDSGKSHDMTWWGAEEFYRESWIDLVNETHCELYGDIFLTEKTFKPLAYGLPFILNASRNSLGHLKQLGYQSFPELFGEVYDNIPGGMKKIAAIGEEIVGFCTQPQRLARLQTNPDILAKLTHNQDLFWNKNHSQKLGELLHNSWLRGRA